ncbi:MAG: hypothetical protein K0R73_899 [Candidatus Midichloriaceae bacterium]|nr:hypothetical protein [Candidatus Midichloriaceae bacterium]
MSSLVDEMNYNANKKRKTGEGKHQIQQNDEPVTIAGQIVPAPELVTYGIEKVDATKAIKTTTSNFNHNQNGYRALYNTLNIPIEKRFESWNYSAAHHTFMLSKVIFSDEFKPHLHQAFADISVLRHNITSLIFSDIIVLDSQVKSFFDCLNNLPSLTSLSFITDKADIKGYYQSTFSNEHFSAIGNYLLSKPKIKSFKMPNFNFRRKDLQPILKAINENNTMLFLHFKNCKIVHEDLNSLLSFTDSKLKFLDLTGLHFNGRNGIHDFLNSHLIKISEAKISLKGCTHVNCKDFLKSLKRILNRGDYKHLQERFEL